MGICGWLVAVLILKEIESYWRVNGPPPGRQWRVKAAEGVLSQRRKDAKRSGVVTKRGAISPRYLGRRMLSALAFGRG